ncbi:hypothetical protein DBR40_08805 [Pedobacter sp. KBW01]|uniref:LytR/AlgR family response regulator transcription factor n=1 Tax=Pedobacter sp. KBW01 TaxID=2153364 RepID=UPI000F598204|nr:response regulator [Pedobacter sp. KBW01]RQO78042.1 hypothetical protein DBR40_08805 [Pedobacter sp. KBW01]
MNPSAPQPHSCVIVDDNPLSIKILEQYVSKNPKLKLKGSFTDPIAAMAAFWQYGKIDFLLLDIQMEISGIDVARMLRNRVKFIVFVTAHSRHAIHAVSDGDSFLLKPICYPTFSATIEQLIGRTRLQKEWLS